MIELHKYHAYGNDFLLAWSPPIEPERRADFSRSACRRHEGVGADGCVFLRPSPDEAGRFEYRIHNRDGSEAGMSGNGARCAAAFLHHQGLASDPVVRLQTRAGEKTFEVLKSGPPIWEYRSGMGKPLLRACEIPLAPSEALETKESGEGALQVALRVGERQVTAMVLSMGNPQCQVFVDRMPEGVEFEALGTGLERHPAFPDRTNVGFVEVVDRNRLSLKIWERGVGPTHSSGTGSSAAAVAAILNGLADSPVAVATATGVQTVEWRPGEEVLLTGWAEFIAQIRYAWRLHV